MALLPLPLLLYAQPSFLPSPRRVLLYLEEKKIPASIVTVVPPQDDAEAQKYPAQQGTMVPVLAIRKNTEGDQTDPASYEWLRQSLAIIEFLEDLCDRDPKISPVPSLRGGDDMVRRLRIRGQALWCDQIFEAFGHSCLIGNKAVSEFRKIDGFNPPSAKVLHEFIDENRLDKLSKLVEDHVDLAALGSGKEGTVTIADICTFVQLTFARDGYGLQMSKRYPVLQQHLEAFERRPSATTGSSFPEWLGTFKAGWSERIW